MAQSIGKHVQAKKHLTKGEFKLFSGSFPHELTKISRRSLNSAMIKTEQLVRKYRTSKSKASEKKAKILEFRLKSLSKAHERYSKKMDRMDKVGIKPAVKAKKSLTVQRKMKVNLHDSAHDEFMLKEKNKIYSKHSKEQRKKMLAGSPNSKRIAGYMSARGRKGQVARDRITSSKDE